MFKKILPLKIRKTLDCYLIFSRRFGHWRTLGEGKPLDENGNFLPWYTYPAIEYLTQFDYSNCTVFEWGSGYSSLFWSRRANKVISVEDNASWFDSIKTIAPVNLNLSLISQKQKYITAIQQHKDRFDIIIIDGRHRPDCARLAAEHLKNGGLIILDNSDWFTKSAKTLRSAGLIQIDFSGFGPVNDYTWTTSLFLSRSFKMKTVEPNQPRRSIGSLKVYNE